MKVEIVATVAERLQQAMRLRDVKQVDLSAATNIDKGSISSYLAGRYQPKDDKIFLMATALRVNPAWLSGFDVAMEEQKPPETDGKTFELVTLLNRLSDENLAKALDYIQYLLSTQR